MDTGRTLTADRRNSIARRLLREGSIKAADLAREFVVSTETIRKDIIYLEEMGLARKSYGGAISVSDLIEQPIAVKEIENSDSKALIAGTAAALIPANATVLLDGGSSTYALANQLTLRDDLIIFTNSVNIMHLLGGSGNQIYGLGGFIRPSSKSIVGEWAIEQLNSIKVQLAFIGTDGFRGFAGVTSASYEEAQLKKAILKNSDKTIALADNTKFEKTSLFQVCCWRELGAVITNHSNTSEGRKKAVEIREDTELIIV